MLLNLIFVIFSLIATTKAQQFNNCGVSGKPTGLIVNGSQSKKGTWPWLVAIYKIDGNKFICGGTLVSSNIIITVSLQWFLCGLSGFRYFNFFLLNFFKFRLHIALSIKLKK